jgi:hypothetical protein
VGLLWAFGLAMTKGKTRMKKLNKRSWIMKALLIMISSLLFWQISFANGFPEKYDAANAKKSSKTTVTYQEPTKPTTVYKTYQTVLSSCCATLYPGSIKSNLVRVAHRFGWNTVVWTPSEDYLWVGHTRICAISVQALFDRIMIRYPLQAQFYMGNHVLAIVPRNLP